MVPGICKLHKSLHNWRAVLTEENGLCGVEGSTLSVLALVFFASACVGFPDASPTENWNWPSVCSCLQSTQRLISLKLGLNVT